MKKRASVFSLLLVISILISSVFSIPISAAEQPSIKCDTTGKFSIAQNAKYTFRLTVSGSTEIPSFSVENSAVLKSELLTQKGNVFDFQVTAVGKPGDMCAIYTALNGQAPKRQCVVTVGATALTGSNYQQAEQVAESVVKTVLKPNMTDYQKYMTLATVARAGYDTTYQADSYTAYGDLIKGRAVCSGMARAFRLLCDKAKLPCKNVISTKKNHEWNMVFVENNWYHIDMQDYSHRLTSDREHLKDGDRTIMDQYKSLPVCAKDGGEQNFKKTPLNGWIKTDGVYSFRWNDKIYCIEDDWIVSKETGKRLLQISGMTPKSIPISVNISDKGVYAFCPTDERSWPVNPPGGTSVSRGDLIKLNPETGEIQTVLSRIHAFAFSSLSYDRTTRTYGYVYYYYKSKVGTDDYILGDQYVSSIVLT